MFEWFFIAQNDIGEPPYTYELLCQLDEKEYPKYLKKLYKNQTNQNLNLRNPRTFGEKIQWLKLYDSTPIKSRLTDKVLVRDYVKEKIGENYLKPVLQICQNFDDINFDAFPERFMIKANHGCKWHYIIKQKEKFLENTVLKKIIKSHFDGWKQQKYCFWAGFEMQYKDIVPQIIIEPLLLDNQNEKPTEIEVYCFNGKAKIAQEVKYENSKIASVYDENLENIDLKLNSDYIIKEKEPSDNLKLAVELSEKLAGNFKLVRVDWLIYQNKIYFLEMTFTPFSGFYKSIDNSWNLKLGKFLNLKK